MFPFLGGMLSGLLGSGAGSAAASGLGGMAANGMGSGAAGNLAGIGQMAGSGQQFGAGGAPVAKAAFSPDGVALRGDNGELLNLGQNAPGGGNAAGTPQSGSPGGMGQGPTQGQSPLMQLPTMNGQDPLMSSNSLLNGIGGPMKQFFGMGG